MSNELTYLCLEVVSPPADDLEASVARCVFDHNGGSIGRAEGNDWVLPDAERVVSGSHARIEFADGQFYVSDQSTNGTFRNGGDRAIGKGNREPLDPGDQLTLGRYEVAVKAGDPDSDAMHDLLVGSADSPVSPVASQAEPLDIGSPPPSADLLHNDEEADPLLALDRSHETGRAGGGPALRDTLSHDVETPDSAAARTVDDHAASHKASFRAPSLIPDDWNPKADEADVAEQGHIDPETDQEAGQGVGQTDSGAPPSGVPVMPRPARAETYAAPLTTRPPRGDVAFKALLEGLGMEGHDMPQEAVPAFCRVAGQVLRECTDGMVMALQARARAKKTFRVSSTQLEVQDNNPLKYVVDADEALFKLFADRQEGYLGPTEAMNAGFADLIAHERAMRAGMDAALRALVDDFDPDRVDSTLQAHGGRGLLGKRGGRLPESYRAYYSALIAGRHGRKVPARFESAFADAYEAALRPGDSGNQRSQEEQS